MTQDQKQFIEKHFPCTCNAEWKSLTAIPDPECGRCAWEQKEHTRKLLKLIQE